MIGRATQLHDACEKARAALAGEATPAQQPLRQLLVRCSDELRHASIFVRSREKMHPEGLKLYDELHFDIDAALAGEATSSEDNVRPPRRQPLTSTEVAIMGDKVQDNIHYPLEPDDLRLNLNYHEALLDEAAHVMAMARDYIRGRGLGASLSRDEILSRMGDIILQAEEAKRTQEAASPPPRRLSTEIDADLAKKLTDNAAWANSIRNTTIEECAVAARAAFGTIATKGYVLNGPAGIAMLAQRSQEVSTACFSLTDSLPASNPHWRCFFCDEVFTTRGLAAEHFGTEVGCDYPVTACQIKAHEGHLVTYIRKLETELGVWNSESHQIQQAIVTLEGEVASRVRRAEDDGYARGVADMKKQGFCVEPQKHEA